MQFYIQGVDKATGESIRPRVIEAPDREAALKIAMESGITVSSIKPMPVEKHPLEPRHVATNRAEREAEAARNPWAPPAMMLAFLFKIAGGVAILMAVIVVFGSKSRNGDAAIALVILQSILGIVVIFAAARMIELLAVIAGALREISSRLPPPDDS